MRVGGGGFYEGWERVKLGEGYNLSYKTLISVAKPKMLAAHLFCGRWRDEWIESEILPV